MMQKISISKCFETDIVTATEGIEQLVSFITSALVQAGTTTIPVYRSDFFKPWWDGELEEAKTISVQAHRDWITMGKPREGIFFVNMYKKRYEYKNID